ncbi:MAG TPA: ATP-dependent DNA ligase [Vicinamibacterales bacterium]|nr:ATP-dependent DNA ligase [Vicinamibacterales bacterium]
MKRFADLYEALDRTTSTNAKVSAIVAYLREAPPGDAAWALFFLTGRRLARVVAARSLHLWTVELTRLPAWLVEESYGAVGDHAETIALLVDGRTPPLDARALREAAEMRAAAAQRRLFEEPVDSFDEQVAGVTLQDWIEKRLIPLRDVAEAEQRVRVLAWWSRLPRIELFLLNKLMTGEFRVGVSHTLVVRAVAQLAGLPTAVVEHRLMGGWEPSDDGFLALTRPESSVEEPSRPYPFCLASPLSDPVEVLGDCSDWLAEWKWDGIRAQLIHRSGQLFLWSRGEELITGRFPEVASAAQHLPGGTVLDGELVAWRDGRPRPFSDLQHRIGRERKLREALVAVPVAFIVFDLLEDNGDDIRSKPLHYRRARLVQMLNDRSPVTGDGDSPPSPIQLSAELDAPTWDVVAKLRSAAREHHVEGVMLKRWSSAYRPGRRRADWWKWKIEPFTVDAVLIYAQPGSGRRASLFTDYTFGVWHDGELVPIAKAYSGLNDREIDELDRWIRRHTISRFGPVSAVEPVHVFELGFERIARSTRHKSGVALRFPRMLRWRTDKTAQEADALETLMRMVRSEGA